MTSSIKGILSIMFLLILFSSLGSNIVLSAGVQGYLNVPEEVVEEPVEEVIEEEVIEEATEELEDL